MTGKMKIKTEMLAFSIIPSYTALYYNQRLSDGFMPIYKKEEHVFRYEMPIFSHLYSRKNA